MKSKARFKYNNGNGALLCTSCNIIIKEGYSFTEEEWKAAKGEAYLAPQYCDKCKIKYNKT